MFGSTDGTFTLSKFLRRFPAQADGSVLPMFALSLVPLIGFVGTAVDYSRVNNVRTSLQASLDSALAAGAKDGSSAWVNVATNEFNATVHPKGASLSPPSFSIDANRAYTGSVSANLPTQFLGVLGFNSLPVTVRSTAKVTSSSGNYYCMMALNPSAQAALQLTGNASITINAPKCVLQVNSSSYAAVELTGNTSINSVQNCFVGGTRKVGNSTISPAPNETCAPLPDPFSKYPRPYVGSCDYTNFSASGGTMTLQPGVYCGGMTFSGQVNVTFAPGLYIVKDGVIAESGGTFTGTGVSFFLTGQGASVQLSGQANWRIVAPTGGPLPGFAIFLDPDGPSGQAAEFSSLSGQSELYLEGIVYLPKQQVTVSGNASVSAPSPYTSFIGDTLRFVGNGELVINNDITKTRLPIPTALMVQTAGQIAIAQ